MVIDERAIGERFRALAGALDERQRRVWVSMAVGSSPLVAMKFGSPARSVGEVNVVAG